MKKNENEARERMHAFWEGSSLGRPALQVLVHNPEFSPQTWDGPGKDLKQLERIPDWQSNAAINSVESWLWLAEAMPGYVMNIGNYIPLLAVLTGGDYEYHQDETAWIKKYEDVLQQPFPRFDSANEWVQQITESIRSVGQALGGRAIVSPPVWIDPLTTLSSFRTMDALCIDLIEQPELVEQWLEAATTLLLKANEYFYQECLRFGQGECLSWLGIMAEGRMDAVQCDFSIMLSPEMYERFYKPTLQRQTIYYDYSIYHLDGAENMRFLNQIASSPGLNALQYTRVAGCDYPGRCLDDYAVVREKGLSLYVNCNNVQEAIEVVQHIGPDGLFISLPPFNSQVEAEKAIDLISSMS